MKRISVFLLLIVSFLLMPFVAYAIEDGNSLVGTSLTSPGATITFDIKVSSPSTIKKYYVDLTYETNVLELKGIENKGNWSGNNSIGESPLTLSFEHESGVTGETTVATLTFQVKKDAAKTETKLALVGKYITASDETIKNLPEFSKTVEVKSTDNTLKALKVNDNPVVNFSPTTYSYSMQVESKVTNADIKATLNDSTATFVDKFGPRNVPLEYGENKIEIKVKSASGDIKEYVINITRNDNRGSNNDLSNIIINSGEVKINFDSNTLEYRIKTYRLKKIDVVATPVDSKATVKVEVKDAKEGEPPAVGVNEVIITVTSEAGDSKTYRLFLDNQDRDIDVTLKDIKIIAKDETLELNPKFKSNILDYEIRYDKRYKDNLVIIPEVKSKEDDVKYDEALLEKTLSELEEGGKVEIRVYAPDGTENIYTITFIKDTRLNFFTILFGVILLVLLIIFIKLLVDKKMKNTPDKPTKDKVKVYKKESEKELIKTKRLNKINLE